MNMERGESFELRCRVVGVRMSVGGPWQTEDRTDVPTTEATFRDDRKCPIYDIFVDLPSKSISVGLVVEGPLLFH